MIGSKGIKQREKKIKADAAKESDGTGTGLGVEQYYILIFFSLLWNFMFCDLIFLRTEGGM